MEEMNQLVKSVRKIRREQLRLYIWHIFMFKRARYYKGFRDKQSDYWLKYHDYKNGLLRKLNVIK